MPRKSRNAISHARKGDSNSLSFLFMFLFLPSHLTKEKDKEERERWVAQPSIRRAEVDEALEAVHALDHDIEAAVELEAALVLAADERVAGAV